MRRLMLSLSCLIVFAGCALVENDELARRYSDDGLKRYQHGDFVAARESYEAALQIHPNDPGLLYNAGSCCAQLGAQPEAERYYTQCLQKDAGHAAARVALVKLMAQTNRPTEATQAIQDWLKADPKSADAFAVDGWLYDQTGDLTRAQARYQQALEFNPKNVEALTGLGQIYEKMNRPERAVVLYERVLMVEPARQDISRRLDGLLVSGAGRPQPD
jgi:tetratricopeptide (TPR) repeat protein